MTTKKRIIREAKQEAGRTKLVRGMLAMVKGIPVTLSSFPFGIQHKIFVIPFVVDVCSSQT